MSAQLHAFLCAFPRRWLQAHAPEQAQRLAAPGEAPVVGREQQRALLQAVAEVGGDAALLGIVRGQLSTVGEPLAYSLLNSASVAAFIDKEQRLNRFFHSHHQVRVLELGDGVLELQHEGLDGRPMREESLFVLGLHLVLLEELGCTGLSARLPGSAMPAHDVFRDALARPPVPAGDASRWRIAWARFAPRRAWAPGLDAVLERASDAPDLMRGLTVAEQLSRLVAMDLAHRWTLDEAARRLGRSRRTLQRALAAEGVTFSRALEDARITEAERMLADPERSITEVGYACGFADAAHFSRRFKARRGVSPTRWRTDRAR